MANDPIHQFQLSKLIPLEIGGVDFSFTNSSLFMVATVAVTSGFLVWATSGRGLIPTRMQSMAEMSYEFVASMLRDGAGSEGMRFFPLVFSLFMFVLAANLIGMFPYFFTVTSHIIVTFALAMLVIGTVIFYGFYKNGFKFLKLFAPAGAPWPIYILLVPIEIISFFARPVTLALRLFANMLAGHIMLKLFAGFAVQLFGAAFAGAIALSAVGILAFTMGVALNALELLVAGLQAYVFAILTCVYLNDALHPAH